MNLEKNVPEKQLHEMCPSHRLLFRHALQALSY